MKLLSRIPLELTFWMAALVLLAITQPIEHEEIHHFTLCPLANFGFKWCPGCGIGRSITQLLHGNVTASLDHHWFGIPALAIILFRIFVLIKLRIKNKREFKLI
ncbi:MAG: DUF2752 domain-containing protein [Pedobacter sp.]|nr:MAG: DUF2752 domain-containing protein [Pedobacter sp.]